MLERVYHWDAASVVWLCDRRRDSLSRFMRGATKIGDGYAWISLGILLGITQSSGPRFILLLAAAFFIELTLYSVIKRFVSRHRPFVALPAVTMLILPPDEFSFPSGHTAAAFVMVTAVAAWFPTLLVVMLPLALLIGISRVYLGVHYPSDVLAGAALGISSAEIAFAILR